MKLNVADALSRLKNDNQLFLPLFSHGSLTVEMYQPQGQDLQKPHTRDELYVIATGRSRFALEGQNWDVVPGDVLFVPAQAEHRFLDFSDDFSTWVFFYGPEGGEQAEKNRLKPDGCRRLGARSGCLRHHHLGITLLHAANHAGIGKAIALEGFQHLLDGAGLARHQQAARGLWVGQQGSHGVAHVLAQLDMGTV